MNISRIGLYKSADDHLADVATSVSRGPVQWVKIEGDPAQAVPVGDPLPGLAPQTAPLRWLDSQSTRP
jgi:hypothetical protein